MATGNEPIVVEVTASAKPVVDDSVPLVLVTGATGYIATHAIQQLLSAEQYRVRGTVRSLKNEEKVKELKGLVPDAKYPLELFEADLQNKESWPPAVQGCKYVLHIASPFPSSVPKNPDEVIRPAVDGTMNVLTACAESGSVKKVVLTSSIAAISCGGAGRPDQPKDHVYTEEDWSPPEACAPYERSKTLAEKAAWDFIKELPEEKKFDLAVINPGFVQGPALTKGSGTSVGIVMGMLAGKIPAVPDVSFGIVDVRDVAQAHIVAMEKPESNGKRHLLVGESNVPFQQVLQWMAAEFVPQGYKVGTGKVPKFMAWIGSFFNADLKQMYPIIGKRLIYNNDRMVKELGIQPRGAKESFIETAYSVIKLGMIPKTPKYHGPGGKPEAKQVVDKPADTSADDKKVEATADDKKVETTADDKKVETTADDKKVETTADDKKVETTADDKKVEAAPTDEQSQKETTEGDKEAAGKESENSVDEAKNEEQAEVPPTEPSTEDPKDEATEEKSQEPEKPDEKVENDPVSED